MPNNSMYCIRKLCLKKKGFPRLASAFDGGVRQDRQVVSRSAMC